MNKALISLAAGVGERKSILKLALSFISKNDKILRLSDLYETFAQDQSATGPFLNCCVEIETAFSSFQLIDFIKSTEEFIRNSLKSKGGLQSHYFSIYLLAYESEIIRTPNLTLPHPSAHRRAFVMIPLASICPDWVHPILNVTAKQLAGETYWTGWGSFFAPAKSLLDFSQPEV
jgi:2-amino-4-hydroxy-6-hydroxymethyldihydropteridine diphosphokinase